MAERGAAPGESAGSLFSGRLDAILSDVSSQPRDQPLQRIGEPGANYWPRHVDNLERLLAPFTWAGWDLPEAYDSGLDQEHGPLLYGTMLRTDMAIDFEYDPSAGELRLLPFDDVSGEWPMRFSMLDADVTVTLGHDAERDSDAVAERAGELGLLDATRVQVSEESDVGTAEFLALRYREWIFEPALQYREIPIDDLLTELGENKDLSAYLQWVVKIAGAHVLPDLIPEAAALGVAAWCWRNNTAVEAWHLPSDVLMARVNIVATKAIRPFVDPYEGIDWEGIEATLTDAAPTLQDGRIVSNLFGEGWPEVQRSVREQVRLWKRIDEDLVGPEATMRLMTIGGSTSYTRHWWGQERWKAICRRIVSDAAQTGLSLPAPYDERGPETLVQDLVDPDRVSDDVLHWLIDMPGAGIDGPYGLRDHREATAPIVRRISLYLDETG